MTLAELAKCLAAQRQRLPIDVPQPDRATVGGAIGRQCGRPATIRLRHDAGLRAGTHGRRWHRHGVFRRRPRGQKRRRLQHVPLDGRLVGHAGHRHPGDADGSAAARGIRVSGVRAARFQGGGEAAGRPGRLAGAARGHRARGRSAARRRPVLGPVLEGHVGRLYVGFEGPAAEVDWMVEQLRGEWAAAGAAAPMLVPTGRAEPLWRWLTEFPADLQI